MKIHPTVRSLLDDIERHCARHHMSPTAFSIAITGDGHLVRRMYLGVRPTLTTIDKVHKYIHGAKVCRPNGRRK